MTAKPTVYKGINFRSRLEARWAAFFDLLEWAWEYEPECDGGYIPDFILHGLGQRRVYVEVKPEAVYLFDRKRIIDKAVAAIGYGEEFLILTDRFHQTPCFESVAIGHWPEMPHHDVDEGDDFAMLFAPGKDRHGMEYDIGCCFGSWAGKLTGAYEGNALFEMSMLSKQEIYALWSRAGNAIQWKPRAAQDNRHA